MVAWMNEWKDEGWIIGWRSGRMEGWILECVLWQHVAQIIATIGLVSH